MVGFNNWQSRNFVIPNKIIANLKKLSPMTLWRHQIRKKMIFSLIKSNNIKILDVGCNIGDFAIELALMGNQVLGIDIRDREIKIAQELAADFKADNAVFKVADFLNEDFKNEKFDGILLGEIIEHFDNPSLLLEKSYNLLNNGGWLIVSIPNIVSLRNRLVFFIKGIFPDDQESHHYYFSKRDLLMRLDKSGFKTKDIMGDFIPFHYGLSWLNIKGPLVNLFIDLSFSVIVKAKKV